MVKVNLLRRRKGLKKQRNLFVIIGLSLFALLSAYFLFEVVSVVYRLINVNTKLAKVKKETQSVSSEILRNNQELNQFILTKYILDEVTSLRNKQFDYSGYLKQIRSVLPAGTDISGVDFTIPGFVNVTLTSVDSNSFDDLEKNLHQINLASTDFNSVVVKSISRDVDGSYKTAMLMGIKTNAKK